jgi:hypothetical protein
MIDMTLFDMLFPDEILNSVMYKNKTYRRVFSLIIDDIQYCNKPVSYDVKR